jgi:hypothetical protein
MNLQNFSKSSIKIVKAFLAATALITATVAPTFAKDKVEILGVEYAGNGCPDGSANVSVSPDAKELIILFYKFIAVGNKSAESRKSCNMSILIRVPQGFQISFYNADYRGYVAPYTIGKFRAEYFFAGQRGPVLARTFRGEIDYNVQDKLVTFADVWSRCGNSVNMQVNAAMTARGQGMATVDSFDLAHRGLVYHIKYRQCR